MRIAKHLPGPRRDSDHHHHRGCACLSPLPWATLSLAVAVEVGHDCAYPILQAGKLRQGQAQGPAHAREEAASWVEVAEVAQGHPASHVATPPSFQMQTSGGSGLTNGHRAGWTLGAGRALENLGGVAAPSVSLRVYTPRWELGGPAQAGGGTQGPPASLPL